MATLTRQNIVEAGLTPTFAACAGGGDVVDNSDGKTFLHVKNGSGGSLTVTIAAGVAATGIADPKFGTLNKTAVAKVVGAGAEAVIGPFKKHGFNNASEQLAITYSGVTSLTIAAYKIDY
ncbi:MAG: hypothetical protein WAZ98_03895 [Cyclobacteriaceae bacterium]